MAETAQAQAKSTIYTPEVARVKSKMKMTATETLFTLDIGRPLGHRPGQFLQVLALGVGEAPISVSSPPEQTEDFEMCIRNVGMVTSSLHALPEGAQIGFRGPFGNGLDPMKAAAGKDILFVAGGLGLAPLRSFIKSVLNPDNRSNFGNITILYGAKTQSELLFVDELEEWRARKDINCILTVDRAEGYWQGHVGVITTLFREVKEIDRTNAIVAMCGPPVMYKFCVLDLLDRGYTEDQIYLSLERHMKCGVGKCGHCQINNLYACKDGPVFKYSEIEPLNESIH